jgi:hypothetical protein
MDNRKPMQDVASATDGLTQCWWPAYHVAQQINGEEYRMAEWS